MKAFDIIVIGAGIAGASVASELAGDVKVGLLERESQPGYHSTGRSAAVFSEDYGPPTIRKLTSASRAFYESPPEGFCEQPLLTPRGGLVVIAQGQEAMLEELLAHSKANNVELIELNPEQMVKQVPVLRKAELLAGLYEPGARDIDVHSLHQGYLNQFRQAGGVLCCDAEVNSLIKQNSVWQINCRDGQTLQAPIVVNAAGAWGDAIARLASIAPLGLTPKRRTAFIVAAPEEYDSQAWPLTIGAEEGWYFKPDAGKLLASPADATPVEPQDIQPEELDIAVAVDRLEQMTTLSIDRIEHRWAGLRSFVADGVPVVGYAAGVESFFWLVGQGGYGIQTAPAMSKLAASLIKQQGVPGAIADFAVSEAELSPARFENA